MQDTSQGRGPSPHSVSDVQDESQETEPSLNSWAPEYFVPRGQVLPIVHVLERSI